MSGLLERYDEATRAEERHRLLAAEARHTRETCLLALRSDGMKVRAVAALVGLNKHTAHRMMRAADKRINGPFGEDS